MEFRSYLEKAIDYDKQLEKLEQQLRKLKKNEHLFSHKITLQNQMKIIQREILRIDPGLGETQEEAKQSEESKDAFQEAQLVHDSLNEERDTVKMAAFDTKHVMDVELKESVEEPLDKMEQEINKLDIGEDNQNTVKMPINNTNEIKVKSDLETTSRFTIGKQSQEQQRDFIKSQIQDLLKTKGAKEAAEKAGKIEETSDKHSIQAPKAQDEFLEHIPCLFLPYDDGAEKVILFFHGNAEDLGLAFDLLYLIGQRLQMHILAVEYPSYGLYKDAEPTEQRFKEDALLIYDYLITVAGLRESDIILFGRSMGSGPSSYLASIRKPHCLILMSAYTSIQNAAKSILGWVSFLSVIVYERFRNIDNMSGLRCPLFLLHGAKDSLIPPSHS